MKKTFLPILTLLCLAFFGTAKAEEIYSYGFETAEPFTSWNNLLGSSDIFDGHQHEGTYSLRLYGTTDNLVVLPEFTHATNTLSMTFWTKPNYNGTAGTFSVGYMTDPTDANTFVALESYTGTEWDYPTEHVEKTVEFNNAPATARIAFQHTGVNSNTCSWFVDDVTVEALSCYKPGGLTVTHSTAISATFSWNAISGATFQYFVAEPTHTIEESDWNNSTTGNTITIGDLAISTAYRFYLRRVCDGTYTDPVYIDFQTLCDTHSAPYAYGFETAEPFECWNVVSGTVTRGNYHGHNSDYSLSFSGTTDNLVVLPEFTHATNTLRMTFWTKPNYNATAGTFSVGYMTDPEDANTFVALESYTGTEWDYPPTYVEKIINFNDAPADARIAFQRTGVNSNTVPWYVDDITVEALDCFMPGGLTVTNSTATSATFSWNAISGATFQYFISTPGHTIVESDWTNSTTENTVTISNLAISTSYVFYLRQQCSETSASDPDSVSFRTLCGEYNTPYEYGFETEDPLVCWTDLTGTSERSEYRVHTGEYSLKLSGNTSNLLVLPEFVAPTNMLRIEFYTKPDYYSGDGQLSIGYVTNPADASTFVAIETYNCTEWGYPTEHVQKYVTFYDAPETARIAFRRAGFGSSSNGWFLDDVTVSRPNSCGAVTGLAIDPEDTYEYNEFVVKWDETQHHSYQVYYSENNIIPSNAEFIDRDGDTHSYAISGLTGNTTYYVWVRGSCDIWHDIPTWSPWSEPITVTTPSACEVSNIRVTNVSLTGARISWDNNNGTNTDTWYITIYDDENKTLAEEEIFINVIPYKYELDLPNNQETISCRTEIQAKCSETEWSETATANFTLKDFAPTNVAVSDITDEGATISWTVNGGHSTWYIVYRASDNRTMIGDWETGNSADVSDLDPGTQYYVIMKAKINDPTYASVWTDPVYFTTLSCVTPTNLAISEVTPTSATFTWDVVEDQNRWQIAYGDADVFDLTNQTTFTTLDAYTNPFTYEQLVENHNYKAAIRNICSDDAGDWSAWSTPIEFTTLDICPVPTDLTVTDITTTGATFTWVNEGEEYFQYFTSTQYINLNEIPEDQWSSADIMSQLSFPNSFVPGTTNYFYLRKNCTYNNFSDPVYVEFTTSECPNPENLIVSNITAASAVLSWDASDYVDSYTVLYLNETTHEYTPIQDITTNTVTLTDLDASTDYTVRVISDCYSTSYGTEVTFTTLAGNYKVFTTEGNWDVENNWSPAGAPTLEHDVILRANATIADGTIGYANSITRDETNTYPLTIADGGQLQVNSEVSNVTMKKNITGYGAGNYESNKGYYLIGNPFSSGVWPSTVTNLLSGTYDLYKFEANVSDGLEWRNYKAKPFNWWNYYGILYANQNNVEISLNNGTIISNGTPRDWNIQYNSSNATFSGWALRGNPFVCDAYITCNNSNVAFYRMNDAGDGIIAATGPIHPLEGFFIKNLTNNVHTVSFSREAPAKQNGQLNINLSQANNQRGSTATVTDRAIVRFDTEDALEKFSFSDNTAKVYIPQDGTDYAVVSTGNTGELPLNFKAAKNGSYTLSFTNENVTFSYLHLIDNLTGADVDLLQEPTYHFDANTTDYESRFKLVFATGTSSDAESSNFGFVNGMGNFVIFGIEGEATLQVIDMMGHVLSSEQFSGSYEKHLDVAAGIYVLRLINGNDVKVQKMIVR